MKAILDQMEEHIAAIRNLQRKFDFHSKILEKLMISLTNWHIENNENNDVEPLESCNTAERQNRSTQ
jgi:hypothetical protein